MSFCPKWLYEAACAAAGAEYLSRQIDLRTVASGYAGILSEFSARFQLKRLPG